MGCVVIASADETSASEFPILSGVSLVGNAETKPIISQASRPLLVWQHALVPGSQIKWERPPVGHAIYVFAGQVEVNGKLLRQEGALIVGQGGQATLRSGQTPATLIHLHRPDDYPTPPSRAGGCVHIVNRDEAPKYRFTVEGEGGDGASGCVYADSGCPTCELWLHDTNIPKENSEAPPHYHTEDEVIFIVKGTMAIGRRRLKPGAAIAIDSRTVYGFKSGEGGLSFINFRPCEPFYGPGKPDKNHPPISERALIARAREGAPVPTT